MLLFIIAFCVGLILGWYVGYPIVEAGWRLRLPWYKVVDKVNGLTGYGIQCPFYAKKA